MKCIAIAEVAAEAGCAIQTAADHVLSLLTRGWLERVPGRRHRGYRLSVEAAAVPHLRRITRLAISVANLPPDPPETPQGVNRYRSARNTAKALCAEIVRACAQLNAEDRLRLLRLSQHGLQQLPCRNAAAGTTSC